MTRGWNARLAACSPAALSLFRAVFGLLFLCHGLAHLFGWPAAAGPAAAVGAWPMWWGGVLELVTGVLISVGLWTRVAAFVASGMMAYAFFVEHTADGLLPIVNGGESAVLYCFGFLLLVFTGGGAVGLDTRRRRGAHHREAPDGIQPEESDTRSTATSRSACGRRYVHQRYLTTRAGRSNT